MRRQYGPGDHEAPCGAPQDLGELSHGLALNPLPVAAEGHQGIRGGCQPQTSIRCTPDALHFCAFGNSAGKHLRMPGGTVPGKNSRENLPAGLCWFSGATALERAGTCLGGFPRGRQAGRLSSSSAYLLPGCDCLASGTALAGCAPHPPQFLLAL